MPIYSFLAYSNQDLGRPATSITPGTFTVSGQAAVMNVLDNDLVLDDEATGSGQTRDTSQQVLSGGFDGIYNSGVVVQSVYSYTVTNNSTGQTGTAHLIRIYNGTNPSSPGSQSGAYYNAFSIPVNVGDSITLSGGNFIGQTAYSNLVICFTKGTQITTPTGPKRIEQLKAGDLVTTRDNGPQRLRWIGTRKVAARNALAPIRIAAGVLGNSKTLRVSPNHRMLIAATANDLHFGNTEVFVAAKHLLGAKGITQVSGGMVTYIHLLFDRHEVVFANDCPSESLFPGTSALNAMDRAARDEVLTLFPELRQHSPNIFANTARLCLNRQESRLLQQAAFA